MSGDAYVYGGAAAMVALHRTHLAEFLQTWREAAAQGVAMPDTEDPNYESLEVLLAHVLGCATNYLRWIAEQLGAAPPDLAPPDLQRLPEDADRYLEQVLQAWDGPLLRQLTEPQACRGGYTTWWGAPTTIDGFLEHAVMHPIRHRYQLERWIEA